MNREMSERRSVGRQSGQGCLMGWRGRITEAVMVNCHLVSRDSVVSHHCLKWLTLSNIRHA